MSKIELQVFDFDDTLFRSPKAPKGYKGAYWDDIRSLTPPALPESVGLKFFNKDILAKAKAASKNKFNVCAVITGRSEKFEPRLIQIFRSIHFSPDYLYTRPSEEEVLSFKLRSVEELIRKHPNVHKLVVYEDNKDQLFVFRAFCKEQGLDYEPNLVIPL